MEEDELKKRKISFENWNYILKNYESDNKKESYFKNEFKYLNQIFDEQNELIGDPKIIIVLF